jgi:hypothetical protein
LRSTASRQAPRWVPAVAVLAVTVLISGCGASSRSGRTSTGAAVAHATVRTAARDQARIRDLIRRFNEASLAGDSGAMCALIDPGKRRYLEQIGHPCEVSLGGELTPDSERDVHSRTITSIDINGDDAVAHTDGADGARDLALRRTEGDWLIVGA